VKEFDARFDNFFIQIQKDFFPMEIVILLLYLNDFEGQFGFILKENMCDSLEKDIEYTMQIEEHIIISKIEPFHFPHARKETKMKTSTNCV
jgi:hypothetical protein